MRYCLKFFKSAGMAKEFSGAESMFQVDDEEQNSSHDTYIANQDENSFPLNPLLQKSDTYPRSRSSSRGRSANPIRRFIKNPIFLLFALTLILVIIVSVAVSNNSYQVPVEKPTPSPPKTIVGDSRQRYDFQANTYQLYASSSSSYTWTTSGTDGNYIERSGNSLLVKHIEAGKERVLVPADAIKNVCTCLII